MQADNRNLNELKEIIAQFNITSKILDVFKFGSGHINNTYKITTAVKNESYLLQKINHSIFLDVDGLMRNIHIVTSHLKNHFKNINKNPETHTLTIIKTKDEKLYFRDVHGCFWRVFLFIDNVKSYDVVKTYDQAYSAGVAFGEFQKQLSNLEVENIVEVLPNFHNIDFRIDNLKKSIKDDVVSRVSSVEEILHFIFQRVSTMRSLLVMLENSEIPLRITHNDTKFNNVLLDSKDQVQCVIDLDTVMPGLIAYDFGDAIRTIINPANEDETDLNKIKLNIPLFEAYTNGYLSQAIEFINTKELESLYHGVVLFPYMQAVRFLTDYINNDVYYHTDYPLHNLVRAKTQIELVKQMETQKDILKDILISNR